MMLRTRRTAGFSLLELLLALGVFVVMMLAIFSLLQTYAERELGRSTSKYMTSIADAMDQILDNVENFNILYSAAASSGAGGYQLVADGAGPAVDNITKNFTVIAGTGGTVQAARILSPQFRALSPLRTPVRILLRVADDPGNLTDTPALDVLIVTAAPRPEGIVRRAASESGPAGGWIRSFSSKGDAVMESIYGSWRVRPSSRLQNTPWYTGAELLGSLNSRTQGAYLVHYLYANLEDRTGDYLYRVPDFDPAMRRNTMYGPLNIGGNDIVGADDVTVGSAAGPQVFAAGEPNLADECVGTVFCVNGTMNLKGSGSVSGTADITGSALVADNMRAATMNLTNNLNTTQASAYGAQNMFVVDGNGVSGATGLDRITVTGNATFEDGTIGSSLNDQMATGANGIIDSVRVAMPAGGELLSDTIVNTRRISANSIEANRLRVTDQLKAGVVERGDLHVRGGRAGIIDIYNSQNLTYGADTSAARRTVVAPRLEIGTMRIESFGHCAGNCGN